MPAEVSVSSSVSAGALGVRAGVAAGAAAGSNIFYSSNGSGNPSGGTVGNPKGTENSTVLLSGKWKKVNESMSDFSRKYQTQITGQEGKVWYQNGVKYDGMKDGVLIDAKGKYSQFVNKNTGEFYDWFSGKEGLVDEAWMQIYASEGAKIQWYFAENSSMNAVSSLFKKEGVSGIELKFEAMK